MGTIVFHECSLRGEKTALCACNKRRTRREKFWQTVSPFNKNAAGAPKTAMEIREELIAERAAWLKQPIVCASCPEPHP